ncbi:hypothetical protein [Nannocystis pusilla]|uniref:hypothetical protein n=1 Tax=Nannocystis pusilla TaxID=889268 RepID=UPI003B7DA02F
MQSGEVELAGDAGAGAGGRGVRAAVGGSLQSRVVSLALASGEADSSTSPDTVRVLPLALPPERSSQPSRRLRRVPCKVATRRLAVHSESDSRHGSPGRLLPAPTPELGDRPAAHRRSSSTRILRSRSPWPSRHRQEVIIGCPGGQVRALTVRPSAWPCRPSPGSIPAAPSRLRSGRLAKWTARSAAYEGLLLPRGFSPMAMTASTSHS